MRGPEPRSVAVVAARTSTRAFLCVVWHPPQPLGDQ